MQIPSDCIVRQKITRQLYNIYLYVYAYDKKYIYIYNTHTYIYISKFKIILYGHTHTKENPREPCKEARRRGGIEPLHVSMPHELKSCPSTSPTHPGPRNSRQCLLV